MKTTEQKGDFLSMFLGTLGASLLGNLLTELFGRSCLGLRESNSNESRTVNN